MVQWSNTWVGYADAMSAQPTSDLITIVEVDDPSNSHATYDE